MEGHIQDLLPDSMQMIRSWKEKMMEVSFSAAIQENRSHSGKQAVWIHAYVR